MRQPVHPLGSFAASKMDDLKCYVYYRRFMFRKKKAVTLKDVAKRAGLSHPAVSQALTGSLRGTSKVSESTRQRVRKIALEMGYYPSEVARTLRTGRSGLIGVVQHDAIDFIAIRRFLGALHAIRETAFQPYIYHIDARFEETMAGMADALLGARVEAVLCLHPPPEIGQSQISILLDAGLPVAVIGESWVQGASVFFDERRKAFKDISRHVLDRGARRIILLSSGPELASNETAARLRNGFADAVSEAGLRFGPGSGKGKNRRGVQVEFVLSSNEEVDDAVRKFSDIFPLYVPGYVGMLKIIERGGLPEAVICQVDAYAIGAMRACSEHGIRVPEDVAFAGFGNEHAATAGLAPLTTADHPIAELSRLAVEDIQLRLNGARSLGASTSVTRVPCKFIARYSTLGKHFSGG